MKHKLGLAIATALMASSLGACAVQPVALPLWQNATAQGAQRILVISDIHLGVDDSFGETTRNKALLVDFLKRSAVSKIDQIVIAGDFLDEWYLPATYASPADSRTFYRKVKENNAEVFAAFQKVMSSGVTLTYVPGNHDMLLDQQILAELLPGIKQARDVQGLGSLRTGARSEIVVEHGHRYDGGASPDSLSNKDIMDDQGSILPFGYFATRMIVTSVVEGKSAPKKELPVIPAPVNPSKDQLEAYAYYKLWSKLVSDYPIAAGFDAEIFDAGFAGYRGKVSLGDLIPVLQADGSIAARLFPDLQQRWEALQKANGVAKPNSFASALTMAFNHELLDEQAQKQHFQVDPGTDVVVFGHSHVPMVTQLSNYDRPKTYANSGTWIDHSLNGPTGTFVAIESGSQSTEIRVLQYLSDGSVREVTNP